MAAYFEFEPEKALVATAYLANRSGETMYTILKMVYVADCIHLERYGRPITGDRFIAMKEGACPSKIYDSMKVLRGDANHNYLPESEHYLEVDPTTYDVVVKDMPSLDALSASEIECLDNISKPDFRLDGIIRRRCRFVAVMSIASIGRPRRKINCWSLPMYCRMTGYVSSSSTRI